MMTDQDPIIRLDDVHKSFAELVVLDGVSLQIQRGSSTIIIGPSGSGKSVLLKIIIGLLKPNIGKVFLNGHEVSSMNEQALVSVRRNVGFVFQGGALFDSMTVEGNVGFPLSEHEHLDKEETRERVRRALQLVGMDGLQWKMPAELSGGQKKRVALARAIVLEPTLVLYDEPTTGLDPVRADLINELILKLRDDLKTTSVVVTHDMASARKVGDRIVMLWEGHFIADAPPEQLMHIKDETVQRFVQGRASKEELRELGQGGTVEPGAQV